MLFPPLAGARVPGAADGRVYELWTAGVGRHGGRCHTDQDQDEDQASDQPLPRLHTVSWIIDRPPSMVYIIYASLD